MTTITNDPNKIKKVHDFIKKHELAVIASINQDVTPESAVVGFSENERLEIIFGTSNTSRKYANLKSNPRIALVIGWEDGKTVQYEGVAEELAGEEKRKGAENHLVKHPSAIKYMSDQNQTFFKVTPKWIKYTDLHRDPWEIIEIIFP